jgi:hypothetical protein
LPPFNPAGYNLWATRAKLALEFGDLWVAVDGTLSKEDPSYTRKNTAAKYHLSRSLQEKFSLVDAQESAAGMWAHLKSIYGASTVGSKMRLQQLWDERRMEEDDVAEDFLRDLERLRNAYNASVEPSERISDDRQIYKLLCSLPASWESFRVAMSHRESLTLTSCQASFLEDARVRGTRHKAERAMAALQLNSGRPRKPPASGPPAGGGHKQDGGEAANIKMRTKCGRCGRKGHWKADCDAYWLALSSKRSNPVPPPATRGPVSKLANEAYNSDEEVVFLAFEDTDGDDSCDDFSVDPVALKAREQLTPEISSWNVDSGASSAMTEDLRCISHPRKLRIPLRIGPLPFRD